MLKGIVCGIERYAIHDGPGIRTLIFLKGCPLNCIWCSNPETQKYLPELYYFIERCTLCGRCIKSCPVGCISQDIQKKMVITDRNKCTGCGKCVDICPVSARTFVGKYMTVDTVMKEIEKDIPFYSRSGGGVTLSGGEIIVQSEFAAEILKRCTREYIHTAIETTGFGLWEHLYEIIRYANLVLFDLKHMDADKHREYTGVSNELILDNLSKLCSQGIPIIIRIPIIPGYNDSEDNMKAIINFLNDKRNIIDVHLLPYHSLGVKKYVQLERQYPLSGKLEITQEKIQDIIKLFEGNSFSVIVGGA